MEAARRDIGQGFMGAGSGFSLSDVIQLKGVNRFTGCVIVHCNQHQGTIFFRDGEVIHAEAGRESGVAAFNRIIAWPGGEFQIMPTVTTTSHTIQDSWKFLLLEAHRLMDERNRSGGVSSPLSPDKPLSSSRKSGPVAAEKLRKHQDITAAVITGRDGLPIGDPSLEAENLAAEGLFLAISGNRLGQILGLGEITSAVEHGQARHLIVLDGKKQYLNVAARPESHPATVEGDIRRILTPDRQGR